MFVISPSNCVPFDPDSATGASFCCINIMGIALLLRNPTYEITINVDLFERNLRKHWLAFHLWNFWLLKIPGFLLLELFWVWLLILANSSCQGHPTLTKENPSCWKCRSGFMLCQWSKAVVCNAALISRRWRWRSCRTGPGWICVIHSA